MIMATGQLKIPLQDAIDAALEAENAEQPRRGYIGASWIAQECARAAWYDYIWASPNHFHGRTLRRFETGHVYEPRVIRWLALAGYEVISENPNAKNAKGQYAAETLGGLLRGHVDGFVRGNDLAEWHLLEVKAMASAKYHYDEDDTDYTEPLGNRHPIKHPTPAGNEPDIRGRWWRFRNRGVRAESQMYYGQMQVYMGISREQHSSGVPMWQYWGLDGPLNRALFVAVNTDTDQVYAELIEYERRWYRAAQARAMKIALDRTTGPKRVKETPLYPPCRFCTHRDICHGTEPMQISCRTCRHAVVQLPDGRRTRAQWVCTRHGRGCGDCTACDDYEALPSETETPSW